MADFSKDSPEYGGNGHYRINGIDFMSVWTFKRKHSGTSENTTPINGAEGKELAKKCSQIYSSTPDFGGYEEILIFPVSELKNHYDL